MTEADRGIEIRPLRQDELDSAVDLVASGIAEIPQFQWLLGDHLTDDGVRRWFAAFYLEPHAAVDHVEAAVDADGTVLGIVAWAEPAVKPAPMSESVTALSRQILSDRPDILDRLQELRDVSVAERLSGEYVEILLGAVSPDVRRSGVPARLAMRARRAAADAGYGIGMSTTDLALGNAHERTYGAVLQKTYPLGSVTTYSYFVSPEQTRAPLA